eukprot:symbB.v1.2.006527.t2/scaffold389.1/size214891/2
MSSHGESISMLADGRELLQVDVRNINGEGFLIRIPASNTGKELQQMISLQIPQKPGTGISLQHESNKLSLHKSLKEQGFQGEATLSYVYTQLDLPGALEYLLGFQGQPVDDNEIVLEGITQIHGIQSLENITLPGSLQSLTFGNGFNQSLENVILPGGLQSLTFGDGFDQSLENVTLPSSLQSLTFGNGFDESMENITLPSSLQSLTFGILESLTFGDNFNQSLENVTLPSSLQSLTFGDDFDQSLENVTLPSSLQSLTFGDDFDQSLENATLPSSLQSLTFGDCFDQSLENVTLPSSLQGVTLGDGFNQSLENVDWPSTLKSLTFRNDFVKSLENVALPSSLQSLTLGFHFDESLENVTLPSSLQSLTFGSFFNQSLENVILPGGLQSLTFGCEFDQSLEKVTLPGSLQSLTFGSVFDQSLENVTLPGSLQSLTFGYCFNKSLENVTLPGSLQSLTVGFDFNQNADAQLLQLQRSLLQEAGSSPCGILHRLHELEGQLAAAEAKIGSQNYELQEARRELDVALRKRPAATPAAEELAALQEKNDFLQALMSRFERKVMVLEEENAKLTVAAARCTKAERSEVGTQAEDDVLHELEGQLALVEGNLRRKDHELKEVKDSLRKEKRNWDSFLSAAKGRTPEKLMSEVESLQSRNGFLSDLVGRFEDKTMVLERQMKSLATTEKELRDELTACRKEQEKVKATADDELRANSAKQQQLMEEAKGAALLLRDVKRENNKKVQELLRQLAEARSKARKVELKELKELKELNGQLVERLGKERFEHAETKTRLDLEHREKETLQLRVTSLSSQLIQLAELNDDLEERLEKG